MSRQTKWVFYIVVVAVAAFLGMALSSAVAANASMGTSLLFTVVMLAIAVGIFVWLLSGNKRVKIADPAAMQAALAMKPADGKAGIYILRKGFVGMLQGIDFSIEGVVTGQAKGNQFLHAEVAPGKYKVSARSKGNGGETQLSVAAGEVAVLRVILEPGLLKGNIVFDRVDPASARADLASVKMVSWEGA